MQPDPVRLCRLAQGNAAARQQLVQARCAPGSDRRDCRPVLRAQALAAQNDDAALKARFAPLAKALSDNEQKIVDELIAVQGKAVDIGGYYRPDVAKASQAMRPSATLNAALEQLRG